MVRIISSSQRRTCPKWAPGFLPQMSPHRRTPLLVDVRRHAGTNAGTQRQILQWALLACRLCACAIYGTSMRSNAYCCPCLQALLACASQSPARSTKV